MKKIGLTIAVLLFAAVLCPAQNLVTGEKAPDLKVKQWLLNKDHVDDDLPTFVEFFFSRSEPSVRRLAVLDGFARDYPGKLSVIVLVRESAEQLGTVFSDKGYAFAVAQDDESRTFTTYGVQFVPFGVLFDARDRVVWFGNSSKFGETELKKALDWK